jgi:glycosyltransferase involved in cell wall biosynthesis/predicted O-methyltransferase YrrM
MNPVQLSPSTIIQLSRQPEILEEVQGILRQLEPDDFIDSMLEYYETGQSKYGEHWLYADQLTVLCAASKLMEISHYLEIGVLRGRSLCVVAKNVPTAKLYGFDLWVEQYANLNNPGPEFVKTQLVRVGFKGEASFFSGDSKDTIPQFFNENEDLLLDIVTVDGDHTEEGARIDLENVLPRIKMGGVLVFDDICHPKHRALEIVWDDVVGSNPNFSTAKYTEIGNGIAVAVRIDQDKIIDSIKGSSEIRLEKLTKLYKSAVVDRQVGEENVARLTQRLKEIEKDSTDRLQKIEVLEQRLIEVEEDRTARLESIHKLERQLKDAEKDRSARLEIISKLGKQLEESEKDRSARLEVISDLNIEIDQMDKDRLKLEELLKESEADRKARLISINKLEELLAESEADRNARLDSIHELGSLLKESEADRKARLKVINELEARLVEAESSRVDMIESIKNLEKEAKKKLKSVTQKLEKDLQSLVEEKERNAETIQDLKITIDNLDSDLRELREYSTRQTQNVHQQAYFIALYEHELNRFPANFLRRVQNKLVREKNRIFNNLASSRVRTKDKSLKCIMIDLTPILPGGENGGAKPMTTALIWHFSRTVAPECEYVLLTSDDAHEELSWLDAPNVRRLCVNQRTKLPGTGEDVVDKTAPSQMSNSVDVELNDSVVETDEVSISQRGSLTENFGINRSNLIHMVGVVLEKVLPSELYSRIYRFYKRDSFQAEIKKELLDFEPDLLFCPFTAPFYHNANVPTVIVVYDLLYKVYPQFFSGEQIYHTSKYLRESCEVASKLICISDYTRGMLIDECNISAERAITIPISLCNLIEKVDETVADMVLDSLGLEKGGYFIYPANFWHHKNHEMMLSVFNIYVNRNPDSTKKLVFTGAPGDRMDYLKDIVKRMGLSESVIFAGYLDVRSFSAVLDHSYVMVFPSLFEGFGIPLLEAMSFDVPVLSSNRTSLPEVGGNAVHYFDPRKPDEILDALELVEEDEDYRQKLINNGRRRVADFPDPVEWAHNYFDIFQEVVSEGTDFKLNLDGIFPDHWAGESFNVYIPEGEAVRFLEFCIELPNWFTNEVLSGFVIANKQKLKKFRLKKGERKVFRYPVFNQGYRIQVKFNNTIQPEEIGLNDDKRYLSCRLFWCRLLTPGEAISIYESGLS